MANARSLSGLRALTFMADPLENPDIERVWAGEPLPVHIRIGGTMSTLLERITLNPEQCGGRPCIRGMRIRVSDVLGLLAAGSSAEEILADYPYLEREDILACLQYAARRLDHPVLAA